jgi:hypothetical protein
MRLTEFADLKTYTLPATDASDFVRQLLCIWPDRSADDLASHIPRESNQPPIKPVNLLDEL